MTTENQTSGATHGEGQGLSPQAQSARNQPIDSRDRQSQNSRPPSWKPIRILDMRKYSDKNGRPRVAFNQGTLHISYPQLKSAEVFNPASLLGKTVMVDFFKKGDILLNGSVVTNDGIIVNRFMVEPNHEVANKLEYELAKENLTNWAGLVNTSVGANRRPTGDGTSLLTDNGINRVADENSQTDFSRAPAGQKIDQGQQGTPLGMQDIVAGQNAGSAQGNSGFQA